MNRTEIFGHIRDDRLKLIIHPFLSFVLFLYINRNFFPTVRNFIYRKCFSCSFVFSFRRSAVCRLEQFKYLIVSYLQISSSRFFDFCGKRRFQHFVTVFFALHFQTEFKTGVTPYLFIDLTCRFLSRQNQMYSKTSSDTRCRDQLFHKFRLFRFQLCKFIYNDDQMRKRFAYFARFIFSDIFIDMVDVRLCEIFLSLLQFCFDRLKRPIDGIPVNICDRAKQMGQLRELIHHTSTLEVNDDKRCFVRMIERCHRKNIRLQYL